MSLFTKKNFYVILVLLFLLGTLIVLYTTHGINPLLHIVMFIFASLMIAQSVLTLIWMLYAWEHPNNIENNKSPKKFDKPFFSFTLLVPARDEHNVIIDTIKSLRKIQYSKELIQVLIICRADDQDTIESVNNQIGHTENDNIKLIIYHGFPINKPHALNVGLQHAKNDIVAIFDAEDDPHPDILNVINTVMYRDEVDVVQSGVQLINYRTHWFSAFNCLEYFFWFKSALHFYASLGVVPLGGNTVFIKRHWLDHVNGWNQEILTEDADIGIRLSLAGAKIRVVYDEAHCTREETPATLGGFIKQRTRWNAGFLQVFFKKDWLALSNNKQKFFTGYLLFSSQLQALWFLYLPVSIYFLLTFKTAVLFTLFIFAPFYLTIMQVITYNIALFEFTHDFKLKYPFWMPLKLLIVFIPYQILLAMSAMRASLKILIGDTSWEKTYHDNQHRSIYYKVK